MEKFIELKGSNNGMKATHLKIEVYYSLGGYNVFTHKTESRGYYISVSPVERFTCEGVTFESYTAFSGVKLCLLEVYRKSKKAEEKALEMSTEKESILIDRICTRYGLEVSRP